MAKKLAHSGTVASWFTDGEAVYLKVAVDAFDGSFLGWAKDVRIPVKALRQWSDMADTVRQESAQMVIPWED